MMTVIFPASEKTATMDTRVLQLGFATWPVATTMAQIRRVWIFWFMEPCPTLGSRLWMELMLGQVPVMWYWNISRGASIASVPWWQYIIIRVSPVYLNPRDLTMVVSIYQWSTRPRWWIAPSCGSIWSSVWAGLWTRTCCKSRDPDHGPLPGRYGGNSSRSRFLQGGIWVTELFWQKTLLPLLSSNRLGVPRPTSGRAEQSSRPLHKLSRGQEQKDTEL